MGRRLILDTNVMIAFERGKIARSDLDEDEVAVAAVTIAELRTGVHLADSPARAADRARRVADLIAAVDVLDYTKNTADHHARLLAHELRTGTHRGRLDLIIAAHAAETGRTVVSFDTRAKFSALPGVTAIDARAELSPTAPPLPGPG